MSVAVQELQSVSVESFEVTNESVAATTEKTARTFFGSTLKELLPLIIVLAVAVAITVAVVAMNVSLQIAITESQIEAARQMEGLSVGK